MASSLRPWGSRFELGRASLVHVSAWRSQPLSFLGCWISCFSKSRPGQHHNLAQGLFFLVTQRSKCHLFHVVFAPKTMFSRKSWASWSSCFLIVIFIFSHDISQSWGFIWCILCPLFRFYSFFSLCSSHLILQHCGQKDLEMISVFKIYQSLICDPRCNLSLRTFHVH